MRVFISIDIPKRIQGQILKVQEKLPEFRGKLVEPENLHLTLKFFGEIDKEKISLIRQKLKQVKFNKLSLKIDSIGVFSGNFIRIVWLHVGGCEELQGKIDNCLKDLFEKEKRFMSHLTIARVKTVKNKDLFIKRLREIPLQDIFFDTGSFSLKESFLDSNGPVYTIIEEYSCEKN